MFLDVSSALRTPGEWFPFLHEEAIPPQMFFGDAVTFDAPVRMEGRMIAEGDTLRLVGRLTTVAHSPCALCLAPVAYPIDVEFDEAYTRVDQKTEDMTEEFDRLAFEGTRIELSQLAMTLAVLELPIRFTCEGACKGDQQISRACRMESPAEHPFSALQQLLTKDQEV